jgi:hypothetical protein
MTVTKIERIIVDPKDPDAEGSSVRWLKRFSKTSRQRNAGQIAAAIE